MKGFVPGPVLGLETSGSLTGAALVVRGRLVGESALDARSLSQEVLLDLIDRLLRAHGLLPRECDRIGVALGPGSFTGIRVGLAAARGLAWGAGCPLAGIPSHEALAWPWHELARPLVLLTGLRRGQVFLEAGIWEGDRWVPLFEGRSVSVESVDALLAALDFPTPPLLLGEAAGAMRPFLTALAGSGCFVEDPLSQVRRPAVIAFLAARESASLLQVEALDRLEPLYLRGADARLPTPGAGAGERS